MHSSGTFLILYVLLFVCYYIWDSCHTLATLLFPFYTVYSRVPNNCTAAFKLLHMTCKEGQFDVAVELSINLNAQNVNGMTHFDLTGHSRKLVKIHVWLLDALWYM